MATATTSTPAIPLDIFAQFTTQELALLTSDQAATLTADYLAVLNALELTSLKNVLASIPTASFSGIGTNVISGLKVGNLTTRN